MRHHKGAFSLLVLEVAFGFVILVHTLVTARFYLRMHVAETGLADEQIVVVTRQFLTPREIPAARAQARDDLAALARIPGVRAAASVDTRPLPDGAAFPMLLRNPHGLRQEALAWSLQATAQAVATFGWRVIAGQGFEPQGVSGTGSEPERAGAIPLLLTRSLALRLFDSVGDAIGRPIDSSSWQHARVVGVVEDFSYRGTWLPHAAAAVVIGANPASEQGLTFVVRVNPDARDTVAAAALAALGQGAAGAGFDRAKQSPDSVVAAVPLERQAARYMRLSRGATVILLWIGVLVVAVALSGSLALASFSVAERTRQIGVRRALGARRGQIVRYFLLENLVLTSLGIALGLVLATALNLVIRQMMAEVGLTADLMIAASAVLVGTGLLSSLVPALRAAATPPWAATRAL